MPTDTDSDALARHAAILGHRFYPTETKAQPYASASLPAFGWEAIILLLIQSGILGQLLGGLWNRLQRLFARTRRKVREQVETAMHRPELLSTLDGPIEPTTEAATDTVMAWGRGLSRAEYEELVAACRARGLDVGQAGEK